jgi:hypothetical protein
MRTTPWRDAKLKVHAPSKAKNPKRGLGAVIHKCGDSWLITCLLEGAPAAHSLLRPGDEILAINSHRLGSDDSLDALHGLIQAGERLTISVRRKGKMLPDIFLSSGNLSLTGNTGTGFDSFAKAVPMDLLAAKADLPQTSITWVSSGLALSWRERFQKIARVHKDLEYLSVAHGLRAACRIQVGAADLKSQTEAFRALGLVLIPFSRVGSRGGFLHVAQPAVPNQPWEYTCIASRREVIANRLRRALAERDDEEIGQLLGYPECCRRFFCDVWDCGYHDPVWQSAFNSKDDSSVWSRDGRRITLEGEASLNPFLRYVGVRVLFHIPHSLNCARSLSIASQLTSLGRKLECQNEMDWIEEILAWPLEWDLEGGTATIRSPNFTIKAPSIHTLQQWSVKITFTGDRIPRFRNTSAEHDDGDAQAWLKRLI